MIKELLLLFAGLTLTFSTSAQIHENRAGNTQIRIIVGDKVVIATLNTSKAAQNFMAMLPLKLSLSDYGQNEKVSDLPKKLSLDGSPSGYTPKRGDLAHYAPWGNFVVFRNDFSYSNSLIKLGEINEGLEALDRSGPIQATIEVIIK